MCRRRAARSSAAGEASTPAISSNCGSASSSASRRPSPQPRSRTRRAPAARSSRSTAAARRSRSRACSAAPVPSCSAASRSAALVSGPPQVLVEQAGRGLPDQAGLVAQVAADDQVPVGMPGQPLRRAAGQLVDLVPAHPVVLVVVEHRQQHVQLAEQVTHPARGGDAHVEVGAVTPVGEGRVQRYRLGAHLVAERLEQPVAAAPRRPGSAARAAAPPGPAGRGQARPVRAVAAQRGAEQLAQRHRQQRGGGIGTVVDVGGERERPVPAAPCQRDRVDLAQQRGGAAAGLCLGVEDVRRSPAHRDRAHGGGVLVQQEPEVRRGRRGVREGEQHGRFSWLVEHRRGWVRVAQAPWASSVASNQAGALLGLARDRLDRRSLLQRPTTRHSEAISLRGTRQRVARVFRPVPPGLS